MADAAERVPARVRLRLMHEPGVPRHERRRWLLPAGTAALVAAVFIAEHFTEFQVAVGCSVRQRGPAGRALHAGARHCAHSRRMRGLDAVERRDRAYAWTARPGPRHR